MRFQFVFIKSSFLDYVGLKVNHTAGTYVIAVFCITSQHGLYSIAHEYGTVGFRDYILSYVLQFQYQAC